MENHYKTLGVVETATDDEIKKAFRKLAQQYHPDVNPGNADAERKFKEINAAYDVLKDQQRRRDYDSQQRSFASGQRAPFGDPFGGPFGFKASPGQDFPFEDLFRNMQNPFHAEQQRKARDIEVPYHINLEDVFAGKETELTYVVPGLGKKTAHIKIPVGIEDGMKIKYAGAGGSSDPNVQAADLYVAIRVSPHPQFTRDKADLLMTTKLDAIDAVLGSEITFTSIDGAVLRVKIPAGTQNSQRIRVKGRGLPKFKNTERGDLYVCIEITVPTNLTDEQKLVLRKYRELIRPNHS
jgi:DnaJ-class molecular chaperone